MFSSQIGLKSLGMVCRSLGQMLNSGISIRRSFDLAGNKVGDARCRRALQGVSEGIARGEDVSTAMRNQGGAFPELLVEMVRVGEQSGDMPEILMHLSEHYENNLKLRRSFLGQIAWPVIQLVIAVFVVALVILVLGMVGSARPDERFDPLGLGLAGPSGALIWLGSVFGVVAVGAAVWFVLIKGLSAKRFVDPILLQIPVVGNCLRSFAIARFSWAFYLTQQTGMPIARSLKFSLHSTANGAFIESTSLICDAVNSGSNLEDALRASQLFPEDYLQTVSVAESSGTVPEELHRLSPQFEDQARRSLTILSTTLAWLVWAMVAGFIIYFIFRIVLNYIGLINKFTQGI